MLIGYFLHSVVYGSHFLHALSALVAWMACVSTVVHAHQIVHVPLFGNLHQVHHAGDSEKVRSEWQVFS